MPTVHLPKKFGLLNAISINMSNMVGTGPFITVPAIMLILPGFIIPAHWPWTRPAIYISVNLIAPIFSK